LTFASGGYIIQIRPKAIGIEVVPILAALKYVEICGKTYPNPTPTTIAKNIHNVRNLFKIESF
jgi:hypothetical protein